MCMDAALVQVTFVFEKGNKRCSQMCMERDVDKVLESNSGTRVGLFQRGETRTTLLRQGPG